MTWRRAADGGSQVRPGDEGAGGVLALAIVGATLAGSLGVLGLGSALTVRQRVTAAADAAALGAAEVLLGVAPGEPCAVAAELALAHRTTLVSCALQGAEAVVTVGSSAFGIPVTATARAGPPR